MPVRCSRSNRGATPLVRAVRYIHAMPGGAGAHLIEADDGFRYTLKTVDNDQHPRVLVNEYLGTRLAHWLGLPVASMALVRLMPEFVDPLPFSIICRPSLGFGSRMPKNRWYTEDVFGSTWREVANVKAFLGMLLFDLWTANRDRRQVVFERRVQGRAWRVYMIDQGYCFNGEHWGPLPEMFVPAFYHHRAVYGPVLEWGSFEPYLGRLEKMRLASVFQAADGLPAEWVDDPAALKGLLVSLYQRIRLLRDWITAMLLAKPDVFPNWLRELQRKSPRPLLLSA